MKNNPFNPTAGFRLQRNAIFFFLLLEKKRGEMMRISNKAVLWTNELSHRILSVYKINFKLKETWK